MKAEIKVFNSKMTDMMKGTIAGFHSVSVKCRKPAVNAACLVFKLQLCNGQYFRYK